MQYLESVRSLCSKPKLKSNNEIVKRFLHQRNFCDSLPETIERLETPESPPRKTDSNPGFEPDYGT